MSGSSSSWSCYLCTFESLNIDSLHLHIDEDHRNLFIECESTADNTKIEESSSKQVKRKTQKKFSKTKSFNKVDAEKFPNALPIHKVSILSRRKSLRVLEKPVAGSVTSNTSVTKEDEPEKSNNQVSTPFQSVANKGLKSSNEGKNRKTPKTLLDVESIDNNLSKDESENESEISQTCAALDLNEFLQSINQNEVKNVSLLTSGTESEPILLDSDDKPDCTSITEENEVEILEFTNSVSSLKVFFEQSYRCALCSFKTHSQRGLKYHKKRSHSLEIKSQAEEEKQQNKIVDFFKMSPKEDNTMKKPTLSNYTLIKTEPLAKKKQNKLLQLFETSRLISSSKKTQTSKKLTKVDAKKGVATTLPSVQMKEIQCPYCPFKTTSNSSIYSHTLAQHKNKNKNKSKTTNIKILNVQNENEFPSGKYRESLIPKPKEHNDKSELKERNSNTYRKETLRPKSNENCRLGTKFKKVTKPISPAYYEHTCKKCNESFGTLRSLQLHEKSVHPPTEIRRYYRRIKNSKYLKYFGRQSSEGFNYHCSICPKQLSSNRSLHRHTDIVHSSFYNTIKKSNEILPTLKVQTKTKEVNVAEEMTQNDFLSLFGLMNKSS